MIVDPDFFDHWKTVVLIEELEGDKAAPLYVLRLWAHCQNRRQWVFDSMSSKALRALCRFQGSEEDLMRAMTTAGFLDVSDAGDITVLGWDEYNSQLIANWTNGKKGGRPRKPKQNPSKTHPEPNGNPSESHGRKPTKHMPDGQSLNGDSESQTPDGSGAESSEHHCQKTHRKPMGNPPKTHAEPIGEDRIGLDNLSLSHSRANQNLEPHPEWAKEWGTWVECWEGRTEKRFDPVRAEMQLIELHAMAPEKAKRDLAFSLKLYSQKICDSDDDWSKGSRRGGAKSAKGSGLKI